MRKEKTSENLRNLRNLRQLFIGGCFHLRSSLLQKPLVRARTLVKIREIAKKVEVLEMGNLYKSQKHNDIRKYRNPENFHQWLKSGEKVEEKWKASVGIGGCFYYG